MQFWAQDPPGSYIQVHRIAFYKYNRQLTIQTSMLSTADSGRVIVLTATLLFAYISVWLLILVSA